MHPLPRLLPLVEVKERLGLIFPEAFPDRSLLVGDLAARFVYVGLYGAFIEGTERYLRPSTVIRFSLEQAELMSDEERHAWLARCMAPGHRPLGTQWYADNTRETLRDDLIRNRGIPNGLVVRREGIKPTSPAPIYALASHFAALFSPSLTGDALQQAIKAWQEKYLDPAALRRMRLLAAGVRDREGQVDVTLPTTGKTLRLAPGESSTITRDVCEQLAPRLAKEPVVVHISISDQKTHLELQRELDAVGLKLDVQAELPDVVFVDLQRGDGRLGVYFVEVVHSDGPVTELRREALLSIAERSGIAPQDVALITAFEDRSASAFRKRASELAHDSAVWFRSEPELLMRLDRLPTL